MAAAGKWTAEILDVRLKRTAVALEPWNEF